MTNEIDQFVEEYSARRVARRKNRSAWQDALQAQTYLKNSPTPERLPDFFGQDPTKTSAETLRPLLGFASKFTGGLFNVQDKTDAELTEIGRNITTYASELRSDYTKKYEETLARQGYLDDEFLLQFSPADLRLMGVASPEEINQVESILWEQELEVQRQAEIDERVEREIEERERMNQWKKIGLDVLSFVTLGNLNGNLLGDVLGVDYLSLDPEAERERQELLEYGRGDELYNDDIATWRQSTKEALETQRFTATGKQVDDELTVDDYANAEAWVNNTLDEMEANVRLQLKNRNADVTEILDTDGVLTNMMEGGLNLMGKGVGLLAQGGTGLIGMASRWVPDKWSPYEWMKKRAEEEQEATLAEYEAYLATDEQDPFLGEELFTDNLRGEWSKLQEEQPGLFQERLAMAGFDPTLAFAMFAQQVKDMPEAREQMALLAEARINNDIDTVRQLQEGDFRVSDTVLNALGGWGRFVNQMAITTGLFLTDEDYSSRLVTAQFENLWTEVRNEARTYESPSEMVGIDGTLSGLLVDLGAGIAFDPTTWLFGPRGSVRSVKSWTIGQVNNLAKSPMVKQFMREAVEAMVSPQRGAVSLIHMTRWMDDMARGEFLAATGWTPNVLPRGAWSRAPGHAAQETSVSFLREVAGPAKPGVKPVKGLLERGFDEPVVVEISRVDGAVRLADGNKRLQTIEGIGGIDHIPATFRVVDEAFANAADSPWLELAEGKAKQYTVGETLDVEARDAVIQHGQMLQDAGQLGKEVGSTPSGFKVFMADDAANAVISGAKGQRFATVVDPTGKVAGGLEWRSSGRAFGAEGSFSTGGFVEGLTGKGLAAEVLGVLEKVVPEEVILRMMTDNSFSPSAAAMIQKYARSKLPAPVKMIDDFLADGEALASEIGPIGSSEGLDVLVRPDQVLPRRVVWGEFDEKLMTDIATRAISRGAVPDGAYRGLVSQAYHDMVSKYVRNGTPNSGITRYMTQHATINRVELTGPGAVERIYDITARLWGDDMVNANRWTEAIMLFERNAAMNIKQGVDRLTALAPMRKGLDAIEDMTGGGWDDTLRQQLQQIETGELTGKAAEQARQALQNRRQMQAAKTKLKAEWDDAYSAAHAQVSKMADTRQLADIITDMYDDFNRQHIATNPLWKKYVDPDTGMVPWEDLRKGSTRSRAKEAEFKAEAAEGQRKYLATEMKDVADALGVDGNKLAQRLLTTQDSLMAVDLPLTPLEMIMAKSTGGAAYTRWTHQTFLGEVREVAFALNKMWVIDKVFRASTAATVSFDELLRIWHIGGPEATFRWMRDRGTMIEARVKAALNGDKFWKEGVQRGARHLSVKKQERLQAMPNIPSHLRAAERQVYDGHGLGWTDITPDNPHYREAASRWTGGLLQDTGFRAYLRGPEAFREWFHGIDGQRLREMVVLDKDATGSIGSRVLNGADEAYQSFQTLFDAIILKNAKKGGMYKEVRQAFVDTARKIDELGGRTQELPAFVYDHLGPVRGTQKHMGKAFGPTRLSEQFFDNLFMNPVNYRRGFLAELVREVEGARIRQLLALQKKRIVSDLEVENMLGLKGLEGASRVGAKPYLHEMAQRAGVITESMVDDIIERAVIKELDNVLFTWDKGSRAGSQARAIFPFGRPWGDMIGFWGREIMRKPVTRGIWNERNFLGIKQLPLAPLMRGIENFVPFNPKPAAMISRLAETDFSIDEGLGEATGTDFSPIFFLPTKGDNPFAAMIPGLGFVPMQMMDMALDSMVDPVEDPLKYQEMVDNIADFLPMFRFQQGGPISRVVGGGSTASVVSGIVDAIGLKTGEVGTVDTYFQFTSKMGDITREINRTRELSALLADPETLEMVLSEEDPETLELLLMSLAQQADSRASGSHLAQTVQRWVVPASSRYDTSIAEITDVWVQAAGAFPQLAGRTVLDKNDPASIRQFAADVRTKFFKLEDWERDLMIAQQPSLAVNLISSWEWTQAGESANLPGVEKSYRTGGSAEDIARHQYYVENGFVRPLQPLERARRVLGMVFAAKENAAKEIYTTAAGQINEFLWENSVTDDTKALLRQIVADIGSDWDIRTERELWDNWSSMESRFEDWLAGEYGAEEGDDLYQRIKDKIKIPGKEKPWGTSWPGVNSDEVSGKFGDVRFPFFDPKIEALADGLGLTLTAGMTGAQLYNEVQSVLVDIDSPAMSQVKSTYDQYVQTRAVPANSAENLLRRQAFNPNYDAEWRGSIEQFMLVAERISERYQGQIGGIPLSEAQEVVDMFASIKAIAPKEIGWDQIWEDRYERTYGALDWVAPEPLPPVDENGRVNPNATAPYFKKIIDGDSVEVVENRGSGVSFEVRLLGMAAADYASDPEGARAAHRRLEAALQAGVDRGDTIYLVRDPDTFGSSTDYYGRMLAWLWIGDEPYYDKESFERGRAPSGGDS